MPPSPHALQPVLQRPLYDLCNGLPSLFGKFPRQLFGLRILNANRHVIRSLFEVHTAHPPPVISAFWILDGFTGPSAARNLSSTNPPLRRSSLARPAERFYTSILLCRFYTLLRP